MGKWVSSVELTNRGVFGPQSIAVVRSLTSISVRGTNFPLKCNRLRPHEGSLARMRDCNEQTSA